MGGGLMQLVAYGAQDIYLTGNPQITFFKVVYRRHTNFSMETIEQTINGTDTANGGSGTVTISRNGDLVHKVYVTSSGDNIIDGDEIVSEVELEIGGQRIDRHFKEWNQVWNELSTDESKAIGLKSMKGCIGKSGTGATGPGMVQIPLNFWFCRNPGLALPLIALQYHEVKLKFTWGAASVVTSDTSNVTCKVMCDYIYLDTDERRRFAQVSHEYLIEQLQKDTLGGTASEKLNFNHPVKELIWLSPATNGYLNAQLKLNGHDRFSSQEEEYFQLRQPFDYHTAVPKQNLPTSAQLTTLDRQTTIALPTGDNGTVLTVHNTLADAKTGASRICMLAGTNELALDGSGDNSAFATEYAVGSQIAIVITAVGSDIASTPAAAPGDIFFANVTAAGSVASTAGGQQFFVSIPTTADGAKTLTAMDGGSGDSTVKVFVVTNGNSAQARTSVLTSKINVYSFALKPEEHQPSGTCNFSRIDTAKLDFDTGGTFPNGSIYAVNYNVLRIMSGMGGLAYSN